MSDNEFTTPLWNSLSIAMDSRAQDRNQIYPQEIPVHVTKVKGSIVTVAADMKGNFTLPQVTMAQAYGDWHRLPTQVGDKGVMRSTGYYIGGETQLGGGTADYYDRANLATMVFDPVSQVVFPHIPGWDNNAHLLHGPNGTVHRDTAGNFIHTVSSTFAKILHTITNTYMNLDNLGNIFHIAHNNIQQTATNNIQQTATNNILQNATQNIQQVANNLISLIAPTTTIQGLNVLNLLGGAGGISINGGAGGTNFSGAVTFTESFTVSSVTGTAVTITGTESITETAPIITFTVGSGILAENLTFTEYSSGVELSSTTLTLDGTAAVNVIAPTVTFTVGSGISTENLTFTEYSSGVELSSTTLTLDGTVAVKVITPTFTITMGSETLTLSAESDGVGFTGHATFLNGLSSHDLLSLYTSGSDLGGTISASSVGTLALTATSTAVSGTLGVAGTATFSNTTQGIITGGPVLINNGHTIQFSAIPTSPSGTGQKLFVSTTAVPGYSVVCLG